ncbi:DUF2335 domain-containing protein [Lachnospiraceae bacterium 50-23]
MSGKKSEEKQEVTAKHEDERNGIEHPDLIELDQREVKKVVMEMIQGEFSGPIPPPNIIEGYEKVLPGSADRIISMAERQSEHRQKMELKMINAESRDGLLGVVFAFMLGLGCIIAAVIMVFLVPQNAGAIAGALLGVTGIGSITSSFISSTRRNNRKNDDGKKK